nr:lysozyme [Prevotella intermedia]
MAKRTCRSLKNNKTIIWPVNGITEQEFLNGINEERATEIFVEDLKIFEEGVRNKVTVPLYQYEFDALVSFLFNCGVDVVAPKLFEKLNKGDYSNAALEMDIVKSNNIILKGLVDRRAKERDIFNNNNYVNHK